MKTVTDLSLSKEALWSAKAIAAFLGCPVDRVYRWADDPSVPICKKGGSYFALKTELWAWLRADISDTAA